MFKAALFTIVKTCQQSKCPSSNEYTKKIWYTFVYTHTHTHTHTHTMEYYSAIKRDEILTFTTTWINLEGIIQSDISQTEKDRYHTISLICRI